MMTSTTLSIQALEDAFTLLTSNNFDADTKECIVTLMKLLDNVIQKPAPTNDKVRNIRLANPNFHSKVGCREGGIEYLLACGFAHHRDPPPLLSTEPGEEKLVLKPDREDQAHLIKARRLLTTRATRDLGMKHDELPRFKQPPPPPLQSVNVATAAAAAAPGGSANTFNPYSGHRVDIASAVAGTNLGPDGNYVSKTETELHKLGQKQKQLEKKLQSNITDREWKAYLPNQTVVVESQQKKKKTASSSSSSKPQQSDASLLKARLEKQIADKKKQETFTTKAMRDLEKIKKQSVYTHTLLTIQFSDGCKVTGKFLPKEKVQKVMNELRKDCLVSDENEFDLYVTPPRRILDLKSSLQQEQLVPAAKIYVSWKTKKSRCTGSGSTSSSGTIGSYLNRNLFVSGSSKATAIVEAFPSSAPVAGGNTSLDKTDAAGGGDSKPAAKKNTTKESREEDLLRRMMGGGGAAGGARTTGGGAGTNKDTTSKKPKWFKG